MELTKEANEIKKAYYKEWRRKNKEKIKEINRRYWEKKAEAVKVGSELDEQR